MPYENYNQWAEFYDLIYFNKGDEDREFYLQEAKKAEGRVLELGCGTGRIYLELLAAGVDALGVDISDKMLDVLRQKAKDRDLEPEVYQSNMTSFDLEQKFDLIMIPFRSFLHNLTIEDQLATLRRCKEHLTEGGRLILNFFVPDPDFIASEDYTNLTKQRSFEQEGDQYEVYTKSKFVDEPNEIIETHSELYRNGAKVWSDSFQLRLIHKREFELLLKTVGFNEWKVYGGWEREELDGFGQEMVWVIKK